jgi:hypothetical protein
MLSLLLRLGFCCLLLAGTVPSSGLLRSLVPAESEGTTDSGHESSEGGAQELTMVRRAAIRRMDQASRQVTHQSSGVSPVRSTVPQRPLGHCLPNGLRAPSLT